MVESDDVTAQDVAAKADEVLGGLGMKHRAALTRDPALDDWPRKLYRRLGFDAVGETSSARRKPE